MRVRLNADVRYQGNILPKGEEFGAEPCGPYGYWIEIKPGTSIAIKREKCDVLKPASGYEFEGDDV